MSKSKKSALRNGTNFELGNIVKIASTIDDSSRGAFGEIVELGPPLKVAVIKVLTFEPHELANMVDLKRMSWNELRAFAKTREVVCAGTRAEIEKKIKRKFKDQGIIEVKAVVGFTSTVALLPSDATVVELMTRGGATPLGLERAADDDYKTGQRVQIKTSQPPQLRGEVVEGTPRIQVKLESGRTRQFTVRDLTKLEPIL